MRRLRLYADTSVFGGCFDEEFSEASRKLFEEVGSGKYILLVSEATIGELDQAPDEVRRLLAELPEEFVKRVSLSEEMEELRDAYIEAGVVGKASRLDAEHIACASVAEANLIVSWNFRHIVHFEKIQGYHGVNLLKGYQAIPIHSPREVVEIEEKEKV